MNKKCNTSRVYLLLIFYALRAFFFLSDVKTPNVAFDREYCFYDFFRSKPTREKKIWFLLLGFCFFWSFAIAIFSLKIEWLNMIGITFGLNRGADLIVYISIILLFYLIFHLLNSLSKSWTDLTRLISTLAIQQAFQENKDQIFELGKRLSLGWFHFQY